MFYRLSINFIVSLCLLFGISPALAEETPPEIKLYFPIVTAHYRPDMVYIPAGPFQMGCHPDHNTGWQCEGDAILHTVEMDAYYIDKYEVTNAQFAECEEMGGCTKIYSTHHDDSAYANHPVEGYFWSALEYCAWAGKHLPSEEEWEKAARGTDLRTYPWGDEPATCELTNFSADWLGGDRCVGDTVEVGSYPNGASPYGALDMAGNALEWVNSNEFFNPTGFPERMSPIPRVVRGGDYEGSALGITTSYRNLRPDGYWVGFRCAASEP